MNMRTHPRRSRIGHFKSPFLVSLAGATVAVACGGRSPDETTAEPVGTQLASEQQQQGIEPGQQGAAGASGCGVSGFCESPAAPDDSPCPQEMPVPGSACYGAGQGCRYPGCAGPEANSATCVGGQWLVHYSSGPVCNPPEVVPVCPNREIPGGDECAYEGLSCISDCAGVDSLAGFVCREGTWQPVGSCP
jgi:hypothetical protein